MSEAAAKPRSAEVIVVHSPVVACDGGGEVLGHPRVFLRISHGEVVCPYCSRVFRLEGKAGETH